MSDLFVSYASADRERVAPLVQRLEQLGFPFGGIAISPTAKIIIASSSKRLIRPNVRLSCGRAIQ